MKNKEIIQGCIKGDRRSQSALYKQYYPLMNSVISRYTTSQDDKSVLINTGFLKVLKNLDKYDQSLPISTWIRRVLVNSTIDEFRKQKNKMLNVHLDEVSENELYLEYNDALRSMEEKEVLLLLNILPVTSKMVFNLYAIDGYKHKEIADMLDISSGTSRWHLNFARNKLKELLSEGIVKGTMLLGVAK
ncbi:MAG: RNA polymerase subunit sigma-24 [Bacteroidetes bacterium]|nr:MAG: RNA polymerase subunit sigma-24 [Bacteroidota bacterium]